MNWEYIAGFFDGEGWVGAQVHNGRNTLKFTWQVTQKKTEVLDEIANFLVAHGFHPRMQANKEKVCGALLLYRVGDVERISKIMLPRVIVKREQVQAVLDAIATRPLPKTKHPGVKRLAKMRSSMSCVEIGREISVNPVTVRKWCREAGLHVHTTGRTVGQKRS